MQKLIIRRTIHSRLSPPSPSHLRCRVTQLLSSSRIPPPVPAGGRSAPAIPNRPPSEPPPTRANPGLPPSMIPS